MCSQIEAYRRVSKSSAYSRPLSVLLFRASPAVQKEAPRSDNPSIKWGVRLHIGCRDKKAECDQDRGNGDDAFPCGQ
jgi:hypothetical protein